MSKSAEITITTAQFIFVISCIIGNSLVCAVIKRNRQMRIPINYLLVNLAVADIFFAAFRISELIYSHINTHPDGLSGKAACILRNGTMQWIGACASAFTVVAIAVERYFTVIYPHGNKKKLNVKKVKVVVVITWVVSLILNIPGFFEVFYRKGAILCESPEEWIKKVYYLAWFTIPGLSFILMAGLYSRVVYTLWSKRQDGNVLTPQQQGVLRVRKRVTLMVFIVSAIFGICWATDGILHSLDIFGSSKLSSYAIPVSHTMLLFNTAVNPFAYALINQGFRQKTMEMLCFSSAGKVHSSRKGKDVEVPQNTRKPITPC